MEHDAIIEAKNQYFRNNKIFKFLILHMMKIGMQIKMIIVHQSNHIPQSTGPHMRVNKKSPIMTNRSPHLKPQYH